MTDDLERERVEAESLLERERVEAESSRNNVLISSKNLIQDALTEGESLIQDALTEGEEMINNVVNTNKNLKTTVAHKILQLKKIASNEIENLRQLAHVRIHNINEIAVLEAESLKKAAVLEAESLKKTHNLEIESIRKFADTELQRLEAGTQLRTHYLIEQAMLIYENRKKIALAKSERLKSEAKIRAHELIDNAKIVTQEILQVADSGATAIREHAQNSSSNLINTSKRWTEEIKTLHYIKTLNLQKKQLTLIAIALTVISLSAFYVVEQINQSPKSLTTGYVIQNLKGDTVDIWALWIRPGEKPLDVHIQKSQYVIKEREDAIRDAIMSQEAVTVDNSLLHNGLPGSSLYYVGWRGALNSITTDTKFAIPKNLNFDIDEETPTGDIMILLTDLSSPDGYSAYTTSVVDETSNQILKSTITVYDINKIQIDDLKSLIRHELGHGLGLGHSTDSEDLMAPTITTSYPYISECDLDAIHSLYDGAQTGRVVCEK